MKTKHEKMYPVMIKEELAAEFLGMAVQTLRNWRMQNRGPAYAKMGRSVRYNIDDLIKFVTDCRIRHKEASHEIVRRGEK